MGSGALRTPPRALTRAEVALRIDRTAAVVSEGNGPDVVVERERGRLVPHRVTTEEKSAVPSTVARFPLAHPMREAFGQRTGTRFKNFHG